jgi:hypothetical protein
MLKSKWYLICSFFIIFQVTASDLNLIKLKYRDAYEVKSLLKPMLAPGGKISGHGYTLIIQTTASNMQQLKHILRAIDIRPSMLKIMVKKAGAVNNDRYLVKHYQTRSLNTSIQSITVLDGRGAFIFEGKEQPVLSIIGGAFWPSVLKSYKKTQTGFYIVPYLRGRQVMLQVIYKYENSREPQSVVELQNMATTVMIPLGRWTSIGGGEHQNNSNSLYNKTYSTRRLSNI